MKKVIAAIFGTVVFYFAVCLILFLGGLLKTATFVPYAIWVLAGCITAVEIVLLAVVAAAGKKKKPAGEPAPAAAPSAPAGPDAGSQP
jgi:hypothetical protein